ncbi:MAG TPA: hypothetical protein VM370_00095 [Candidatus Thermoplasmatota archaeon]|nr:hypothetical protein [Candidatus Thermoplasmatota archaeon]
MLERLAAMGNQLPPRLKALLNLAITLALVLMSVPFLWRGIEGREWAEASTGAGLLLLGVFNLFT